MCKPVKDYLELVRDYSREIITFGGFIIAAFLYWEFKNYVVSQNPLIEKTLQIHSETTETLKSMQEALKAINARLELLEREHIKAGLHTEITK